MRTSRPGPGRGPELLITACWQRPCLSPPCGRSHARSAGLRRLRRRSLRARAPRRRRWPRRPSRKPLSDWTSTTRTGTVLSWAMKLTIARRLMPGASAPPVNDLAAKRQHAGKSRPLACSVALGGTTMMDFRILGSLEVLDGGRQVPLGGTKQRAVLAILLLHRGEVVSVDRLVDELWGERPPDTATKTVQVYVSRLRKALGEGVLVTRGGGYVPELDAEQLDAGRFERLAREGRDALAARRRRGAAQRPPSPGARPLARAAARATSPTSRSRRARSPGSRSSGWPRSRTASRPTSRSGEHAALVPELERLVREHPARERLREQLILALYRVGPPDRRARELPDARRALVEELGLEPEPRAAGARARDPRPGPRDRRARARDGPRGRPRAPAPRRRARDRVRRRTAAGGRRRRRSSPGRGRCRVAGEPRATRWR